MVGSFFNRAKNPPRIDPLALDLDADGIETTGITAATQTLFDHNGDGTKTGTGWLKGDDAWLALDKNANGTIDNGNELFGVDTVMSNGQKATSGFAALADLDSNHDGVFNNADAQYGNVRVWRDLDQDGVSDAGELQSLADAGIASISLTSTAGTVNFASGNSQSASATFTRTDGSTGTAANLNLTSNAFYREFGDKIPLTVEAAKLPGLQGSGAVRDLQEAASLNAALIADVNGLAGTTRSQMMSQLDTLIRDWANSSTMQTSQDNIVALLADTNGLPTPVPRLLYRVPGVTDLELQIMQCEGQPGLDIFVPGLKTTTGFDEGHYATMKAEVDSMRSMMAVLEKFNGQTFLDFPAAGGIRTGNGLPVSVVNPGQSYTVSGFVVVVPVLTAPQVLLLQQSYDALKQSVYDGLVLQTRLKGYMDAINLSIDQNGINLDFSGMNVAIDAEHASDPVRGLVDLIDLTKHLGSLSGMENWSPEPKLSTWMSEAAQAGTWEAVRSNFVSSTLNGVTNSASSGGDFYFAPSTSSAFSAGAGDDFVVGTAGNDVLNGEVGNDTLYGGAASDSLNGGDGNDVLDGGADDDTLYGENGVDTLQGGKGNDTL
ncbi:MAG: hypothetical protein H6R15_2771, partial [Proteobacteria bacterium]|nr:hypothetical protein [Pseudomonadota bacterium]